MREGRKEPPAPVAASGFRTTSVMSVTLICPRCQGGTELRGTMDAWYLTWCPECERIWRIGLWTLLDDDETKDAARQSSRDPVKST